MKGLKTKKPVNHTIYRLLIRVETLFVGAAGFEPATSWSQTRRDDRTTLRPEYLFSVYQKNVLQNRRANLEYFFILTTILQTICKNFKH